MLVATGAEQKIERVNQRFVDVFGYSLEELPDFAHWWALACPDAAYRDQAVRRWDKFLRCTQSNTHAAPIEEQVTCKDGSIRHIELHLAVIGERNIVELIDLTAHKKAEREIEYLAYYDPLTTLPNRRLLMDRLRQGVAACARYEYLGALLLIDLNDFKTLNETQGHHTGDMLLQQVAQRLETCVREGDTVARLSGDEFVVMLEHLSKNTLEAAAQAETIAGNIFAALNRPYQLESIEYLGTASMGATLIGDKPSLADDLDLMKQSDIALYQAKLSGRNTFRFFDPKVQKGIEARASLERDLRKGIELSQFQLYYQVQMDATGLPTGAEGLIRWLHPERGQVLPAQFIPQAEESGLILPIGKWVLESACAKLKAWEQHALTRNLVLAINVSAKQFHQRDFVAQVTSAVTRHDIKPRLLELELTEGMLLENIDATIACMKELSSLGIRFSLDDFGTGYSSLQYLKRLPLHQLKIDQSFVRDIATDANDRAIVQTIVAMARNMKLDVIAEGVESGEQRQSLLDLGCEHYQGYLFSKPTPSDQLENLLKRIN
jgi:diguanylate cyclase (GGDEF)-like protein/PAS domain S-box-containing protein